VAFRDPPAVPIVDKTAVAAVPFRKDLRVILFSSILFFSILDPP